MKIFPHRWYSYTHTLVLVKYKKGSKQNKTKREKEVEREAYRPIDRERQRTREEETVPLAWWDVPFGSSPGSTGQRSHSRRRESTFSWPKAVK